MKIGPLRVGKDAASGEPGGVDGRLIYVIGDVHGCYELLKDLLARVAADIEGRAGGRRPELIFLGDYVDRGPHSSKVLDALVWLQRRGDLEVRLLKGNHEQALLEFIDAPDQGGPWIGYGGAQTLESYGIAAPSPGADPAAYGLARDDLLDKMPASHLRLLQGLELMVLAGDYAFVHAGVRPGASLDRQAEDDLLWIRQGFLDAQGPFEKIIVHGHTWTSDQPVLLPQRIGVDTGAYATGVLTALRLEDHDFGILQARTALPPPT
ncbi:MAG TPA: metallophosphoesterase family protein [Caulobacteraceae bacterium]|jgi:serine/threonine protein phosphatase 1|nr:metallophosphoesterase family protein [Caulobacteraceae bacterium]